METPKTLLQAARYFADIEICKKYMRDIRWQGSPPACPECGSLRLGEIKTRHLLRCKDCRKQFSSKVGTIFEDSPLGLDKWFVAVWAIANCKNCAGKSCQKSEAQKMSYPQVHNITFLTFGASSDLLPNKTSNKTCYDYVIWKNNNAKRGRI